MSGAEPPDGAEPPGFGELLRRSRIGKLFTAAFPGTCFECSEPIEPGDDVLYYDGELVHEECCPELVPDD
jgi:hypothetical protein